MAVVVLLKTGLKKDLTLFRGGGGLGEGIKNKK